MERNKENEKKSKAKTFWAHFGLMILSFLLAAFTVAVISLGA